MRKGLLIHNLKAGSLDVELLPKLVSALGEVVSVDIEQLGEAGEHHNMPKPITVIGSLSLEGMARSRAWPPIYSRRFPLGIIPTGTFNNFARSLGLPLDPIEACHVILAGNDRPTDVGFANGRPFFECLGSGLDAALYPLGEEIKSGRILRLLDFMRRAYQYPRQKFVLALDRPASAALVRASTNESRRLLHFLTRNRGSNLTLSALMLTVSNGPYFGMNYAVAPHGRWASYRFGFQPLQQTSTLVALCLHCLWAPGILSEIHRLSCRKAASGRPAKTAGSPRRLSSEGSLAARR